MTRRVARVAGLCLVLLGLMNLCEVFAIPPVAAEFYGHVIINGRYAPAGTRISVYSPDGMKCGEQVVGEGGTYGMLSCNGDDLTTDVVEGAKPLDGLVFYVNGIRINTDNSIVWKPGIVREANLVIGDMENAMPLIRDEKVSVPQEIVSLVLVCTALGLVLVLYGRVLARVRLSVRASKKRLEELNIEDIK